MTHPSLRRAIASLLFAASLLPSSPVMAITYLRGDASQATNLNADAVTRGTLAWPRIEDITCPPGQYPNKVVKGRWVCSAPTVTGLAAGTYTNAYNFNNRDNLFTGNGAALTNLNASNLTTGKVIWDRIADIACPTPGTVLTGFSGGKPVCATVGSGTVSTTGGVSGSGSANTIPLWTSAGALGGSILTQNGNVVTVNGALNASTLSGSGANITAMNAANITTGSLSWNRIADVACSAGTVLSGFSAGRPVCVTLPSGTSTGGGTTGGSVTSADQITSGMLSDARLSTNVVLRNGTQTFTGVNTFSNTGNVFMGNGSGLVGLSAANISSGTLSLSRLPNGSCAAGQFLTGLSNGTWVCATPSGTSTGGTSSGTANALAAGTYGNVYNFSNTGNTFTGTHSGSGSGLTSLNASNITSGSLPWARISGSTCASGQFLTVSASGVVSCATPPAGTSSGGTSSGTANALAAGTYGNVYNFSNTGNTLTGTHSGSGAGLTSLNASNISSGTLSPARLPSPNCPTGYFVSGIGSNGTWTCTPPNGVSCPAGYYMTSFTGTQGSCLPLPQTSSGGVTGTGAASTLARWTSGTTVGSSAIQDNGSSVAIGTSPVSGTALRAYTGTASARALSGEAAATGGMGVYGSGGGVGVYGTGGGAGVAGQGPRGVEGTGSGSGAIGVSGNAPSGIGVQGTGASYGVYGQGQYGVGGSGSTFGVYGNATTANGYGVYGENLSGGYSGYFAGGKGVAIVGAASNYGIGLKVDGRIMTGDSSGAGGVWVDSAQQKFMGANGAGVGFYNNGWGLLVDSRGYSSMYLAVGGDAGQVCWKESDSFGGMKLLSMCSSLRSLKEDIKPTSMGLETLRKLNPVTFKWKDGHALDLGFIAEDVEAVNPIFSTYSNGKLVGVKYNEISALTVGALKETDARVSKLEQENRDLKARVDALEALIRSRK